MVRAIVEQRSLAIDDYLVYVRNPEDDTRLERLPVRRGEVRLDDEPRVLAWLGSPPEPVRASDAAPVAVHRVAATGDLAFAHDHFHPNKAPGAAWLAVPAYAAIHALVGAVGGDPDDWWTLTVSAWLTTTLSVGLLAAIGVAVFWTTALLLFPDQAGPAFWATIAFAFGTLYFPYATMLHEHDVVAVSLLGGFALLARDALAGRTPPPFRLAAAGVVLGWGAISTYVAVVPVAGIGAWLAWRVRRATPLGWLGLGLAVPFAAIVAYNLAAFDAPFTTNYRFQSSQFLDEGAWLGVLGRPSGEALLGVLVSPYRGLFFSAPFLLLGVFGLGALARSRVRRPEAVLFASLLAFFVLFNASFNGWHGGSGVGPRYLIPALPFLGLAATWAFARWPRPSGALAAVSIATMFAFTAVDPQWPWPTLLRDPARSPLLQEPLREYTLPLFLTGKPGPTLDSQLAIRAARAEAELRDADLQPAAREERLTAGREALRAAFERGDPRLPISLVRGPVSANPQGVYEGWYGVVIPPPAPALAWNSFNAGELWFPGRRVSLLVLLAIVGPLLVAARAHVGSGAQGTLRSSGGGCAGSIARSTSASSRR